MNRKHRFKIPALPEINDISPSPPKKKPLNDADEVNHLDYIKNFLTGSLVLPGNKVFSLDIDQLDYVEVLGSGNYGFVRRMCHRESGHHIAVKRIRVSSTGVEDGSSQSVKRLRQEIQAIQAASSTNCDHIVQYYGLVFNEGDAYLCMELMDISLEHLYQTVKQLYVNTSDPRYKLFDENTLGAIGISIVKALTRMKDEHHIIHRDIKPSNILLNAGGNVKLCDFGICGFLQNSVVQSLDAGCRPYMAPEKLNIKNRTYDIRSDVWSMGITMIEVANLRFPYPGFDSAPVFAQLQMVVYGDPPVIEERAYSTRLRNFTSSCVIKDVKSRPTFLQLMDTAFYQFYDEMRELQDLVSVYVRSLLPHRQQFKSVENSVA